MALSKIEKEKSVKKMVQQNKGLPGDCKNMVIRHFRKYHYDNYLFVPLRRGKFSRAAWEFDFVLNSRQ